MSNLAGLARMKRLEAIPLWLFGPFTLISFDPAALGGLRFNNAALAFGGSTCEHRVWRAPFFITCTVGQSTLTLQDPKGLLSPLADLSMKGWPFCITTPPGEQFIAERSLCSYAC